MARATKKVKLKDILTIYPNMKILKDDYIEIDAEGNYLINVGYERVSTDKQAEKGFGLDIQEGKLKKEIEYRDYPNFVAFVDDGYTGTEFTKRPALNLIIEIINNFNAGKSNIRIVNFVVPRIDRLGRSMFGILQFCQDYLLASEDAKYSKINKNKKDIAFMSIDEPNVSINPSNPMGKMTMMLFAMLAEYDRDNIVIKMRQGKVARLESGKWLGGGNVPYGYRYNKDTGKLEIIEEQAKKIRETFRLYIDEHMSPNKIAEILGFTSDVFVRNIINRKSLTGCIIYNDKDGEHEVPNAHDAIISLYRWEEGQEEMAKRSTNRGDSENMLMGLCICGECNGKMRYQKYGNYHKIVCYSHYKSTKPSLVKDPNCPNLTFTADDVEDAVIQKLFEFSYLGDNSAVKNDDSLVSVVEVLNNSLKDLDKQTNILMKSLKLAKTDKVIEEITKEMDELEAQKITIRRQIEREEKEQAIKIKVDRARELLKNLKDTFPSMTKKEKQTVCSELIESIVIYKNYNIDVNLKLKSYLINKENI